MQAACLVENVGKLFFKSDLNFKLELKVSAKLNFNEVDLIGFQHCKIDVNEVD